MFTSTIKICPAPGHERAVLEVLDSLRGPISANSDCLGCTVTVEAVEGGAICYTEHWRSRDALERHLRSAMYKLILEALELSCKPPDVAFYEARGIGGLELIEQVRSTVSRH